MKKRQLVLRLSLSVILLSYIISRIDFGAMRDVLVNFSPLLYASAFAFLLISQFSHSFILNSLMGIHEKQTALVNTFKALAASTFLGMFLPGGAGPDIMLAYNLSKNSARKENPLSAIISARVLILFSSALLALFFSFTQSGLPRAVRSIFIAVAAVFFIFSFATLNSGIAKKAERIFSFLKKNRWTHLLYKTYFVMSRYRDEKRLLLRILPVAFATSAFRIAVDYMISKSLGLVIPLEYFFIFVPLVSLAAVMPVSISGIGVREGTYVGLFATIGVSSAEAFSISILAFSAGILFAFIGAVIYVCGGAEIKPPEEETADDR
jgi:glycosyltransferase 2 family protein